MVCGNAHGPWACDVFKKLAHIDRYKKMKENKLCFLCTCGGHAVKDFKMKEIPNITSTETVETQVSLNTFGMLTVYQGELSKNGKEQGFLR